MSFFPSFYSTLSFMRMCQGRIKGNIWALFPRLSFMIPRVHRPFPSSLVPPFQNESKCETFHLKMTSACSFIFMQIKVIFIGMVSHFRFALKQRHKGTRKWPTM